MRKRRRKQNGPHINLNQINQNTSNRCWLRSRKCLKPESQSPSLWKSICGEPSSLRPSRGDQNTCTYETTRSFHQLLLYHVTSITSLSFHLTSLHNASNILPFLCFHFTGHASSKSSISDTLFYREALVQDPLHNLWTSKEHPGYLTNQNTYSSMKMSQA